MRVGIISENYENDSIALKVLLEKHFLKKKVTFLPICRTVEGDNLLNTKSARKINIESKKNQIDLVILAKDLDSLLSDKKRINEINNKIKSIAKQTKPSIVPFIVIYEQEALILADIQTFNKEYKISYKSCY